MYSPLEQFEILAPIFLSSLGTNVIVTNFGTFIILTILFFTATFYATILHLRFVSFWCQILLESFYKLVSSILYENLNFWGNNFFILILTLFLTLVIINIVGLVPYTFTETSHILLTFGLSFSIFVGLNLIALSMHKFSYLNLFLPSGVPFFIAPLLVPIELISHFIKAFTLAIRLFTNITSGHTLLNIIASFTWAMICNGGILFSIHLLPLILLSALIFLELMVAILQAYVFMLLTIIYLNDAINLH